MSDDATDLFSLRIDLSAMVRRSVATLYSHLVTRPTGQALRLGIESQIGEVGTPCLSILDFREVVVMDYSCADETIAKLLQRYMRTEGGDEVYFVARGIGERHLEAIDAVLDRHGLALVAEVDGSGMALLGPVAELDRAAWRTLQAHSHARASQIAGELDVAEAEAESRLESLARRRVLLRRGEASPVYVSLSSLLPPEPLSP